MSDVWAAISSICGIRTDNFSWKWHLNGVGFEPVTSPPVTAWDLNLKIREILVSETKFFLQAFQFPALLIIAQRTQKESCIISATSNRLHYSKLFSENSSPSSHDERQNTKRCLFRCWLEEFFSPRISFILQPVVVQVNCVCNNNSTTRNRTAKMLYVFRKHTWTRIKK